MLTIRKPQMDIFAQANRRAAIDRMFEVIRKEWASEFAQFGDATVRRTVEQAFRKADEYKLANEGQVVRYLNLMYTLGCDFDTDPGYPWARKILSDPYLTADSKLDLLADRTVTYLERQERA